MCRVQQSPRGYEFPDAAEDILSAPVQEAFSCEARPYGYYADVSNNCEVFHICLPLEDAEGNVIDYAQWSFVCGNTTIFDQQGGNSMAFILERVCSNFFPIFELNTLCPEHSFILVSPQNSFQISF